MTDRDLAFLEALLEECSAELEGLGIVSRADRDYEPTRRLLAAALLCQAGFGQDDPDELKQSALQALGHGSPPRRRALI